MLRVCSLVIFMQLLSTSSVSAENRTKPKLISERQLVYDALLSKAERKFHRRAKKALRNKISVDFNETPLKDVAAFLAKELEVPVRLDTASLGDEGIPATEPITLTTKAISAEVVLELLLDPLNLTVIKDREMLTVTTKLAADEKLHAKFYDVTDLQIKPLTRLSDNWLGQEGIGFCEEPSEKIETEDPSIDTKQEASTRDTKMLPTSEEHGLSSFLMDQTEGPWFDIEGIGGECLLYRVGNVEYLAIRQTDDIHEQVLNLLINLRKFHNMCVKHHATTNKTTKKAKN